MEQLQGRRRWRLRASRRRGMQVTAVLGSAALVSALGVAVSASAGLASAGHTTTAAHRSSGSCRLGNGIKHVISIQFDNTHFFRDNPNVPSDLQLMPNLLHFIEGNGTLLSNNHTPLIAHTANDIVTTFTGLYGDRQGLGIGNNSYNTYNADGTTDHAGSFAYWTDPVFDETTPPGPGHDTAPNLVYSTTPPATTNPAPAPNTITPAPWAAYTRAGCNVGDVSIANADLENTGVDIPKVFGAGSPEVNQLNSDTDHFKDAETADYVGVSVHCAKGAAFCADAKAVKFGQTSPSPSAVADVLPDEPGGYNGFQALFGHRYIAPQLGAGTPNVTHNGFQVTNAAGNLVDLNGNQINGAFLTNHPGFPGFGDISPAQTLGYTADLLESGVPVVYGYISDLHGNHGLPGTPDCNNAPDALGSGTLCYIEQAQAYNQQFGVFFKRLAADGITPKNSLFIFTTDEGDHEVGANVGRFVQPTPAGCDGAKVSGNTVTADVTCNYPAGTFGELGGNITGLLATQKNNTTPFSVDADSSPYLYVKGQPGPNAPQVRQLEHDVAGLTNANPYTGTTQPITNYLADPTEMSILHMVSADPARTPTFTMFAKPDYFLSSGPATCSGSCVTQNTGFAYDHGDYAAEINTNWLGLIGPGVKRLGLDGTAADDGPSSAGRSSGQVTVPGSHTRGPWVDETDVRPTTMYLVGLQDDYQHDGRVITQVLTDPNHALRSDGVTELGACYKQLNSSVGQFGTFTLQAATAGIESTSPGDATYTRVDKVLRALEVARDRLAGLIKGELEAAAFGDQRIHDAGQQTEACESLIDAAHRLAT
jgi:hypothetical protein